jgi:hypothetical protein
MPPEVPPPDDPHARHMRWMFLAVVTGSFLFLIPWIAYLSVSLPTRHVVDQWRVAWVGFDGALIAAIGITALCAWRRLRMVIPWAMVAATLLCCDAWFDIVLDWGSPDLTGSVLTAVFAELPLAALLLYVARKMTRLTVIIAWRRAGHTGPVPPLSRLSLVAPFTQDSVPDVARDPLTDPVPEERRRESRYHRTGPSREDGAERRGPDGGPAEGTEPSR